MGSCSYKQRCRRTYAPGRTLEHELRRQVAKSCIFPSGLRRQKRQSKPVLECGRQGVARVMGMPHSRSYLLFVLECFLACSHDLQLHGWHTFELRVTVTHKHCLPPQFPSQVMPPYSLFSDVTQMRMVPTALELRNQRLLELNKKIYACSLVSTDGSVPRRSHLMLSRPNNMFLVVAPQHIPTPNTSNHARFPVSSYTCK